MHVTRQLVPALCAAALCIVLALPAAAADPVPPAPLPETETLPTETDPPEAETPPAEEDPPEAETPPAEEDPPEAETPPEDPEVPVYREVLADCAISDGQLLDYTVLSPVYAGSEAAEGYYPGALTLEITGQVVVEAGGALSLGTLSVGGDELSPVLTGTGSIVVRSGGSLRLTGVTVDPSGGLRILQEDGGAVSLTATSAPEGVFQWGTPLVDNRYDAPEDLWLETGTPLTADLLPAVLSTTILEQGTEQQADVALVWDLSGYDGRTDGTWTVTGGFLDDAGQPLESTDPLTLTVRWYTPEALVVTSAVWKGDEVASVQLTVAQLPEDADVWGEVSADGVTWVPWDTEDRFFVVPAEPSGSVCVFVPPDGTPRWYRVAAESWWDSLHYRSDAFYLYPEETEDSGGNRGGSILPVAPNRTPTPPESEPEDLEAPVTEEAEETLETPETPEPVATAPGTPAAQTAPVPDSAPPDAAVSQDKTVEPAAEAPGEALDEPVPDASPEDTAPENGAEPASVAPAAETAPEAPIPAEEPSSLPTAAQVLLVAGGVGVCGAAAWGAARLSARRRAAKTK